MENLAQNWEVILLAFLAFVKVITNITPTEKDDKIINIVDNIIDYIIPNRKKGGGTHTKNVILKKK